MSGNNDSERQETSAATDREDDNVVVANSESNDNPELSSREANYDSNNSNEDGVMVITDHNGSGGDSDGVVVSEDAGREDMFLDAPDDLGDGRDSPATFTEAQGSIDGEFDHRTRFRGLDNEMQNDYMVDDLERLRSMLDKAINEKESLARECKDEMEMAAKEIANLRDQMRDLISKQSAQQSNSESVHHFHGDEQMPLHEMINECSMFLRSITEEIQDLNRKSTELSVSHEVVNSYLSSAQNESAEFQFQKDQYTEEVVNRMLSSLASLVYVGDLSDSSVTGKITHIEKSVLALIENYNWFLYQSDQLRQCLTQVRPDHAEQSDYGVVFAAANDVLLGSRQKETDFCEKLSYLENENSKLMEQLDRHKEMTEATNAELERLKAELEQEKHRYSNTKEKLSLAVTKGKALVQQRDSLRHALADKTSELERCLSKLEEDSSALKAAELIKEELIKSQISGALLQDMLEQKDLILENLEEIIFQASVPQELKSEHVIERIRWLADERNALKDVSLKFHQLAGALQSVDLPENLSFPNVESRLGWLTECFNKAKAEIGNLQEEITIMRESLSQAKAEVDALQDENVKIREAAHCKMDHLTALLSTVLVEKDYAKMELEDVSNKFEAIARREHQASAEKEQMLRVVLEASGVTVADKETAETPILVEQCLAKLKERTSSSYDSCQVNEEILQSLQILSYVKDQDLALCELLLEEDMQKQKTDMDKLSQEVATLKEEKETLKRDLERSEDKNALIREKLSMAVKKGKGLVQERENMKQLIDEKNSEIEKLKLELEQKESTIIEYKNESSRLSAEVQVIGKLEDDLLALKGQRDQLQIDLLENSKIYRTVTESIDSIILPVDSNSVEPVEKLRQIAAYLSECLAAKADVEQQLKEATVEIETLSTKVSEGNSIIKSLEDSLAAAGEKISLLAEEKRELEVGHASVQQQLQKAIEDAGLLAESDAARKSLENALAVAETNIFRLEKEKEESESARGAAEAEVHKARAEIADLTGKLSEASMSVEALEETVSRLETRISQLSDENNEGQICRANLENDLKKLKEEVGSSDSNLQAAYSSTKSLKEALAIAESRISELVNGKKVAEQEISTMSAKLNACMEELAGTHGNLESRSLELFDYLKALELLGKDDSVLPSMRIWLEKKFESLKEMDSLFRGIRGQFAEMGLDIDHVIEVDIQLFCAVADYRASTFLFSQGSSFVAKPLSVSLDAIVGMHSVSSDVDTVEADDISLYAKKIVENFHERKRITSEKVDSFLSFLNECNASVMQELQIASNKLPPIAEKMSSMDQKMKNMEMDYQALENEVITLEGDVSVLLSACTEATVLLSACTEATEMLQSEVDERMLEVNSTLENEAEYEAKSHKSKHMKVVQKLLLAATKLCSVCELFEKSRKLLSSSTEELQNNLNEMRVTAHKAMEERDMYNSRVHMLETDLAALENLCSELRLKMEIYQDIEVKLREKESEISSLQNALMMKEKEAAEALWWESNFSNLQERANRIDFSADSLAGDFELQNNTDMNKLQYIIDYFPELQLQVASLTHEKDELQSALAASIRETGHLKERVQESISHEQELDKVKIKVTDMEAGLNRIIRKFAGRDVTQGMKSTNDPIVTLEDLVMTVMSESENLRSRAQALESEVEKSVSNEHELTKLKAQLLDLEVGLRKIIQNLTGGATEDQKPIVTSDLVHILEKMVMTVILESENLKSKAHQLDADVSKNISDEQELAELKAQLFDLEVGLQRIIRKFRGDIAVDQKPVATNDLIQALENMVITLIMESENAKSRVHELDSKLLGSQKAMDELLSKVRTLEDSLQSRGFSPETVQDRRIFEAPSRSPASEISETEDVGSISKPSISPVPSAAHIRTTWKGSSDHIAVNIDSESSRLIEGREAAEDKGHVFKSLNTSGLIPRQGKVIADRIDGIWVSSDRLLRSRPGARLGLVQTPDLDSGIKHSLMDARPCGDPFDLNVAADAFSSQVHPGFGGGIVAFANRKSAKKMKRNKEQQDEVILQTSDDPFGDVSGKTENPCSENDSIRGDFPSVVNDSGGNSITIPSRGAILKACCVTSGLIAVLGLAIRQLSHAAASGGLPVFDCSEVSLDFEMWHLGLITGLVVVISLSRYTLLKTWPDFAESSDAANRQVLTSLQTLDYVIVAFLPGISEGALVVATIFGILHFGSGRKISFAIWATFVGLAYGYATIFSSSMVVPMASHALNNLVGALLWRFTSRSSEQTGS
ncbi:hypothetical protein Cgig2_024670 [Carnegiea gigantea]|uniref:CAAX prenyl protease 2/Lysostaphin resistance protein A-like domain-containing protein n=1 Tax=Carnegiea gigantea TaxID=171969 RepID=A0A9Q1K753_9CARY|nr:hypothetical protein Cgig2_024670 [Carnegiea gigantea]